ncbi:MAG TPA: hypothetical protein VGS19_28135 [Streptosporangiaceae bacterium]|nr:hypothetical protein [Streptosporangiaceae bacterium]
MRYRTSFPAMPGRDRRPGVWRSAAGVALAAGAGLALAAIAPPATAASGTGPATVTVYGPKSLTGSGAAALAVSAAGRYPLRPGTGSGAVLWEQVDGRRYTVPDVAAPHSRWEPASGTRMTARPGQAQATLRLKVTNLAGQPASNVQVVLMNTDKAQWDPGPVTVNGTAQVTVLAGDYSLFALFTDFNATGRAVVAFHCVYRDDFRVGAAGAMVTVAERSATQQRALAVPGLHRGPHAVAELQLARRQRSQPLRAARPGPAPAAARTLHALPRRHQADKC